MNKFLVATSQFEKFGPVKLTNLKNFFGDWEKVFFADFGGLTGAGLKADDASLFIEWRKKINPDEILKKNAKEKISIITIEDENYPRALKEIFDPPYVLYYRGSLGFFGRKRLAIVGSRKCTHYGAQMAQVLVPSLIRAGLSIVSGLALGIDSLAHKETLKAGGLTAGILGSGLDRENFYPSANWALAEKIISEGGAVMSEYPTGTPPLRRNFPLRNRIISGLSDGVLVIEAGQKSGSLITAKCALDQGREIFAVPGNIYSPTSFGPNSLIKLGAHPVTEAGDIIGVFGLEELLKKEEKAALSLALSEAEKLILKNLSPDEPKHINELASLTKLDIKILNSTLSILEIKGTVKNTNGGNYIKNF